VRAGRGKRLVSKVVDEANSELLNIEELSKPNRTIHPLPQIP
jgi:hypothetical protein